MKSLEPLKVATHLPDTQRPFHGLSHPAQVLAASREVIERLERHGVRVDREAIERGLTLHDSLTHVPANLLGFRTAEELAAHLTYQASISEGKTPREARSAERVVLATSPHYVPTTPEEIVARTSDLSNLRGSYQTFSEATLALYRETVTLPGRTSPFADWLVGSYKYLAKFLWPMLELTPEARDEQGRSVWHTKVMSNILRLWRETYGATQPVVVEIFDPQQEAPNWRSRQQCFWIGVHPDARIRSLLSDTLNETPLAPSPSILLPGNSLQCPLPAEMADEVVLYDSSDAARAEATRLLRPGGRILCGSTQSTPGKTTPRIEDNLRGWATALETMPELSLSSSTLETLRTPMAARYRRLREEGLLKTAVVTFSGEQLLREAETLLKPFAGKKLYAFIEPLSSASEERRWHGVVSQAVLGEKLLSICGVANPARYLVTVQEAHEILYNANVLAHRDGSISVEFCAANELPSRSSARVLFSAQKGPLDLSFQYSTTNPQERALAYEVIQAIPRSGEGREQIYRPGYYEIAVAKSTEGFGIVPLFFDFRDDSFFLGAAA